VVQPEMYGFYDEVSIIVQESGKLKEVKQE
jgi:hypothetical protein